MNIRSGGGRRITDLLRFLDQQKPDVVVLTEWRANRAAQEILNWVEARGWHHVRCNDGSTANGVLVAAVPALTGTSRTPVGAGAGTLLHVELPGFALLACYFPQGPAKRPFFERCAEIALAEIGRPFLLIGDLNTGNQIADKTAKGGAYHCADMFDDLSRRAELHDLWRLTNGIEAREWTWLSTTENGFRIDHAFANSTFLRAHRPTCRYDHSPWLERLSDHSMILVEYD